MVQPGSKLRDLGSRAPVRAYAAAPPMNGLQRARQSTQCQLKLNFLARTLPVVHPKGRQQPSPVMDCLRSGFSHRSPALLKTRRRNHHDASRLWPTGQREEQPVLGGALNRLILNVTYKITICIQKCYAMLQINCFDVRERLRSEFCCLDFFWGHWTSLQWPLFLQVAGGKNPAASAEFNCFVPDGVRQ